MIRKSEKASFKIWEENGFVQSEVRFIGIKDEDVTRKFRDTLIGIVQENKKLCLIKRETGSTGLQSEYILFEKDVFADALNRVRTFDGGKKDQPPYPGFLASWFNTKASKQCDAWFKKRAEEWDNSILTLALFVIETDHDYPYVYCKSRIHTSSDLLSELRKSAQAFNIELEPIS